MEFNNKLAIDSEPNIARKTIKYTYREGVVVRSIHVIGKKFDVVINKMEIAGGHSDGRHRARVRGAEEWITFGSQPVVNMNDITKDVAKAGGSVDLK
ncbi:unnamed protein product [Alternaria sp. RS040]